MLKHFSDKLPESSPKYVQRFAQQKCNGKVGVSPLSFKSGQISSISSNLVTLTQKEMKRKGWTKEEKWETDKKDEAS